LKKWLRNKGEKMTTSVEEIIIGLIEDFTDDWGIDLEVSRQTLLKGDIGFDSSDTMQLFAAIAEHYSGVEFRFQDLVMEDGKYTDDLKVGQVIAFVIRRLAAPQEKTA
jgi:acyl carrier protein